MAHNHKCTCGHTLDEHKKVMDDAVKTAAVTKSYGTGTPSGGTPNDPTEDVQDEETAKVSSTKTADIGIKETPKILPPRNDMRRHLDKDVRDEVMEGVKEPQEGIKIGAPIEGDIVPRRTGNFKLYAIPAHEVRRGKQFGELIKPLPASTQVWYVGNRDKALPIINENWGPVSYEQENEFLRVGTLQLDDVLLVSTNVEFPITKSKSEPPVQKALTSAADYELDRDEEAAHYLDEIGSMKNEAKAAFMEDPAQRQYAVDAEMTMEELWNETGSEFMENYWASAYAKRGSIRAGTPYGSV